MRVKVWVCTNMIGSKCSREIEVDDWDELTGSERDKICQDVMYEMIEWNYREIPE